MSFHSPCPEEITCAKSARGSHVGPTWVPRGIQGFIAIPQLFVGKNPQPYLGGLT
jgi:hypothetical protein